MEHHIHPPLFLTASVALCTFNGERFVEEQVRSILDQTVLPAEIVVFDDRSTDATVAVLERLAATAVVPIRITVNEARRGSTANFLAAIGACSGDVIFLSDQDDVWRRDKVAAMLSRFAADPALGLVVSDAQAVDESLKPLGYTVLGSLPVTAADRRRIARGQGANLVLKRPFGTGSSMAFRRNLVPAILELERPGEFIHDTWILTVAAALSSIVVMNEPLNLYRQHAAQQVGAPPKWRARDAGASPGPPTTPRASHRRQLEIYRALQRVLANQDFAVKSAFADTLRQAIKHAERRLSLPARPWSRGCVVLRELLSGRYRRFSSGFKSAAKDLVGR